MSAQNKFSVDASAVHVGSRDGSSNGSFHKNGEMDSRTSNPIQHRDSSGSWPNPGPERTNTFKSLLPTVSSPWEHGLSEKRIGDLPPFSDTTRYFDRKRQTRRVFLDCLFMWLPTAFICACLGGTMYGFSTLKFGMSQTQKYVYNSLITGLSLLLGLAFAAQFKQYCEVLRWRFLASKYRSLEEFDLVLGCDSYRNTMRLILGPGKTGKWYPTKSQLIAAFWFTMFLIFNVAAALLGLTYSIDVSEETVYTSHGVISVADLNYISAQTQPNHGLDYEIQNQQAASNLWGSLGQNFQVQEATGIDDYVGGFGSVFTTANHSVYWYRFIDQGPGDGGNGATVLSSRTITSTAQCAELEVTFGGYAGYNTANSSEQNLVRYRGLSGAEGSLDVSSAATGTTSWIGVTEENFCGPRCSGVLALQSATNDSYTPTPRLWVCNNTISVIQGTELGGFDDTNLIKMPNSVAQIMAGAIGWSGITTCDVVDSTICSPFQNVAYAGDSKLSPPGSNATAESIAELVMKFTTGAISAIDSLQGPRFNVTGSQSPSQAQVVNVKWKFAGTILGGIPTVQLIMLFFVVWFSSKAIILDPSFFTIAHALRPVIDKLGPQGCLLSLDEMSEKLGDVKFAYGVRPDPNDPGHQDTTFVRHVGLMEESEGFGYVRGRMPEGRYD